MKSDQKPFQNARPALSGVGSERTVKTVKAKVLYHDGMVGLSLCGKQIRFVILCMVDRNGRDGTG